jgi:hypothetical protein
MPSLFFLAEKLEYMTYHPIDYFSGQWFRNTEVCVLFETVAFSFWRTRIANNDFICLRGQPEFV